MAASTAEAKELAHPEIDKQKIMQYMDTFGLSKELTDQEKQQFIEIACAYQLNPFKREIHVVAYGKGDYRSLSIIVGYETYIKRAERTGKLDGWRAYIDGTDEETKAIVEIWRKDWEKPFIHEVYWKEAAQRKKDGSLTSFWKKQPRFQLKKVAISQAFRMCFPDELGGMGYDPSEIPDDMNGNGQPDLKEPEKPVTESPKAPQSKPGKTIQFPSPKEAGPSGNTNGKENEKLRVLIETMLSTNGLSFPKANIDWIKRELKKDLPKERLEEIISHMNSVIDNKDDGPGSASEDPESQGHTEDQEELIF
jgi:phage recombination protein Bet